LDTGTLELRVGRVAVGTPVAVRDERPVDVWLGPERGESPTSWKTITAAKTTAQTRHRATIAGFQ
jgi:hypothetical protein